MELRLSSSQTAQFWRVPVLFSDEHVLALDKPAGLAVSPDPLQPEAPSLMELLHAAIAEQKTSVQELSVQYVTSPHGLDVEATGVLLLARSKEIHARLSDILNAGRPCRSYLVLSHGVPREQRFEIAAPLGAPAPNGLVRVKRSGKRSRTLVEALEQFNKYSLLRCEAVTDRPQQIPAHLRHVGLRLVGDRLNGGKPLFLSALKPNYRFKSNQEERPLIGRAALHAESVVLPHPVTEEPLSITAPMPHDFVVALKYLRRFAGEPSTGSDFSS